MKKKFKHFRKRYQKQSNLYVKWQTTWKTLGDLIFNCIWSIQIWTSLSVCCVSKLSSSSVQAWVDSWSMARTVHSRSQSQHNPHIEVSSFWCRWIPSEYCFIFVIEDTFSRVIIHNTRTGKNCTKIVETLVDSIVFFIKLIIHIHNLLTYQYQCFIQIYIIM